jgi:hypothetical protein
LPPGLEILEFFTDQRCTHSYQNVAIFVRPELQQELKECWLAINLGYATADPTIVHFFFLCCCELIKSILLRPALVR